MRWWCRARNPASSNPWVSTSAGHPTPTQCHLWPTWWSCVCSTLSRICSVWTIPRQMVSKCWVWPGSSSTNHAWFRTPRCRASAWCPRVSPRCSAWSRRWARCTRHRPCAGAGSTWCARPLGRAWWGLARACRFWVSRWLNLHLTNLLSSTGIFADFPRLAYFFT